MNKSINPKSMTINDVKIIAEYYCSKCNWPCCNSCFLHEFRYDLQETIKSYNKNKNCKNKER